MNLKSEKFTNVKKISTAISVDLGCESNDTALLKSLICIKAKGKK